MPYDYSCCPAAARSSSSSRPARSPACCCASAPAVPARTACSSAPRTATARCSTANSCSSTGPTRGASSGATSCSKARPPGTHRRRRSAAVSCAASSNSARGIRPDDLSDQARARRTADLKDFDNIIFIARIGIEKGKPKNDGYRRELCRTRTSSPAIITPDKKDWHPVEQPPPFNGGSGAARLRRLVASSIRDACSGHHETGVGELIAMTRTDRARLAGHGVRDRGCVAAACNRRRHRRGAGGRQA